MGLLENGHGSAHRYARSGPERSALAKFVLQYRSRQDEGLIWQHSRYHWFKDKWSHKCITRAGQESGKGECETCSQTDDGLQLYRAPIQESQKLSKSVVQKYRRILHSHQCPSHSHSHSPLPGPSPYSILNALVYSQIGYIPSGRPSLPSPVSGRKAKNTIYWVSDGGWLVLHKVSVLWGPGALDRTPLIA
jgi:hypothetical protein